MSRNLWFEVGLLASRAKVQATLLAIVGGLVLLTQFTPDVFGINRLLLDERGHHPSSEVVGGEILDSPLWNLERTMALWTLDCLAARTYSRNQKLQE